MSTTRDRPWSTQPPRIAATRPPGLEQERQHRSQERNAQGIARAIHQAAEHVASKVIGAQQELPAQGAKPSPTTQGFAKGRQQRRKQRHQNVGEDHQQTELGAQRRPGSC